MLLNMFYYKRILVRGRGRR